MVAKQQQFDRFRILSECSVSDLGPVMSQLARIPGLTVTGNELVTEVANFARNTKQHDVKAEDFLAEWIKDHPTFTAKEVLKHFRDNGRTNTAMYYGIRMLIEKNIIKKLSEGNYARADVRAIEAPNKEKPAKDAKPAKKPITRDRHDVDHRQFILNYMRSHGGKATTEKLRNYFDLHGRKPTSVGGALDMLKRRKLIKGDGEGAYALVVKKPPTPKQPPPSKPNGNGNHVEVQSEAVTNG